jgi:hypothetical protein
VVFQTPTPGVSGTALNALSNRLVVSSAGAAITGGLSVSGTTTLAGVNILNDLTISGNLVVDGTTTTFNSTTLDINDKNIELGKVESKTGLVATLSTDTNVVNLTTGTTTGLIPGQTLTKTTGTGNFGVNPMIGAINSPTQFTVIRTDTWVASNHATAGSITFTVNGPSETSATGGGITVKGTTDKTLIINNGSWSSSEHFNIASGKQYRIDNNLALDKSNLRLYGTNTGYTTISTANTSVNDYVVTLPAGNVTLVTGTEAVLETAQIFTAAKTFRASNAIRSEAATNQDAIIIAGRAGGTSS